MQRLGLDVVISHEAHLAYLQGAAKQHRKLRAWLKVDSGMHRLGFVPERVLGVHTQLKQMAGIDSEIGFLTHFAESEVFDGSVTPKQIECFNRATQGLTGERSLSNSAAVLGWPDARADWVRTGGLLYGLSLIAGQTGADLGFRPAMTLHTSLVAINRVSKGERIGYNGTWICPEDMPIGIAAIGYGDGYPRSVPSGTPVLLGKQRRIFDWQSVHGFDRSRFARSSWCEDRRSRHPVGGTFTRGNYCDEGWQYQL